MKKVYLLVVLLITMMYGAAVPEFDGCYIKLKDNTFVELQPTKVGFTYKEGTSFANFRNPKNKVAYIYDEDRIGMHEIDINHFSGIAWRDINIRKFKDAVSLHELGKVAEGQVIMPNGHDVLYVPISKIRLRKKSLESDTYYFKPRDALHVGEYLVYKSKRFYLFRIISENRKKLFEAVRNNDMETVINLLDKGADINTKDGTIFGVTILMKAIMDNNPNMAKMLIKRGADVTVKSNLTEFTALHNAVSVDNQALVRLLLEKGADVNSPNIMGINPPICEGGNKTIKILIEYGAKVNVECAERARDNSTPLQLAIENNDIELAKLLLINGADVNALSHNGRLLIEKASSNNMKDMLLKFMSKKNIELYKKAKKYKQNLSIEIETKETYDKACKGGLQTECIENKIKYPLIKVIKDSRLTDIMNNAVEEVKKKYIEESAKEFVDRSYKDGYDVHGFEQILKVELGQVEKEKFTIKGHFYSNLGQINPRNEDFDHSFSINTEVETVAGAIKEKTNNEVAAERNKKSKMDSLMSEMQNIIDGKNRGVVSAIPTAFGGENRKVANIISLSPTNHDTTPKKQLDTILLENHAISMQVHYAIDESLISFNILATNKSGNAKGGVSLSFPDLYRGDAVRNIRKNSFDSVSKYGVGSMLWSGKYRKQIKSKYLLVEGWSKKWHRGETKRFSFAVDKQSVSGVLRVYLRAVLVKNQRETKLPESGSEDQQGYPVKEIRVNLSNPSSQPESNTHSLPQTFDPDGSYYKVIGIQNDTLNVRAAPSGKARRIAELPADARNIILLDYNQDGRWRKIRYEHYGPIVNGWVYGKYIDKQRHFARDDLSYDEKKMILHKLYQYPYDYAWKEGVVKQLRDILFGADYFCTVNRYSCKRQSNSDLYDCHLGIGGYAKEGGDVHEWSYTIDFEAIVKKGNLSISSIKSAQFFD